MYDGNFRFGVKSGYGKLIFKNEDRYEGSFCTDVIEGQGEFIDHFGNNYTGKWINGKQNGWFEVEL